MSHPGPTSVYFVHVHLDFLLILFFFTKFNNFGVGSKFLRELHHLEMYERNKVKRTFKGVNVVKHRLK